LPVFWINYPLGFFTGERVIALENVVKSYNGFTAVNDISLTVAKGQFFGFLGPNGAGKTTTIKMMTGLLRPTSGVCRINAIDVQADLVAAKRCIGYVPDQPYLYDRLTGREFLLFLGGLFRLDRVLLRARMEEYVTLFEMAAFIDKPAEGYSQGMRQRVALAGSLIHDPQVLIIDEPLLGLDPRSTWLVKATLKRKTREGLTVFMSTHLLRVVEELCDRIAIVKDGRIIYEEVQNDSGSDFGRLEQTFLEVTR
jgi:ABC-2 type transport system ATP-binding protein